MALDVTILALADRGPVLGVLSGILGREPVDWLAAGHPAAFGELPRRWPVVASSTTDQQRVEAVALAGPTHCIDGWAYLSRSLSATFAGDVHAARHLAYYAQLRAALSILASSGIGIFNRINFVVRIDGTTARIDNGNGLGTHAIAWDALVAWVENSITAEKLLASIKIQNVALVECLSAIWPGFNPQSAASEMIKAWGFDLRQGKADHDNRNRSSYSPSTLNPIPLQISGSVPFVRGLWELFEPSSSKLDRFLLRRTLWRHHDLLGLQQTYAESAIRNRYDELPVQVQQIGSRDFLLGIDEPDDPQLIQFAQSVSNPARAEEMIARAALLLKIAVGLTHSNFVDAGMRTEGEGLRPWLDQVAVIRGFWSPASPAEAMRDLWDDVAVALEELDHANDPEPQCIFDLLERQPVGLPRLTEAERIGLWSLCQ